MSKVVIAMPTAHANVKMHAMQTVVDTSLALRTAGHDVELQALSCSELVWGRNYLASIALSRGASHLYFIDSDMYFPPEVSLKLLEADKDVIGAIYPRRQISIDKVVAAARSNPSMSPVHAMAKAMEWVVKVKEGPLTFENGVARVVGLGMGATLIKTNVFQSMIDRGVVSVTAPRAGAAFPVYSFFELLKDEEGAELSEDFSFCARWIACGGKVFALNGPRVGHVGDFTYRGSFADYLS